MLTIASKSAFNSRGTVEKFTFKQRASKEKVTRSVSEARENNRREHTPLPALTERTRMPHIQRYAQRWYNYPMKNKAP